MTRTILARVLDQKTSSTIALLLYPFFCSVFWPTLINSKTETLELVRAQQDSAVAIDHSARRSHAREILGSQGAERFRVDSSAVSMHMQAFIEDYIRSTLPEPQLPRIRRIARSIIIEANRHQVDPIFLMAMISRESHFNTEIVGSAGEIGLMQIKPSTAEWMAKRLKLDWDGRKSLFEPETNIRLGAAYISYLRGKFPSHAKTYVGAYNMGPLNMRRWLKTGTIPETYANEVISKYYRLYSSLATQAEGPREFNVSMGMSIRGQIFGRISDESRLKTP